MPHRSWCKGFTKDTHPSVAKISRTMKARKIDNFRAWRLKMMAQGKIRSKYPPFKKSGDLAEYIGVVLGDGHIEKFPRTERITIVGDVAKPAYIERYAKLTELLFEKKPTIAKEKNVNALRLGLYQKHISRRLGIPTGNRKNLDYHLPKWIENNNEYITRFLRGLFEAEGSLCIHLPTCTYNFAFSNTNKHLLGIVEFLLRKLEFHPEVRNNAIRIRKKVEVERLKNLISFRQY